MCRFRNIPTMVSERKRTSVGLPIILMLTFLGAVLIPNLLLSFEVSAIDHLSDPPVDFTDNFGFVKNLTLDSDAVLTIATDRCAQARSPHIFVQKKFKFFIRFSSIFLLYRRSLYPPSLRKRGLPPFGLKFSRTPRSRPHLCRSTYSR